jgi:hypothetical protein
MLVPGDIDGGGGVQRHGIGWLGMLRAVHMWRSIALTAAAIRIVVSGGGSCSSSSTSGIGISPRPGGVG